MGCWYWNTYRNKIVNSKGNSFPKLTSINLCRCWADLGARARGLQMAHGKVESCWAYVSKIEMERSVLLERGISFQGKLVVAQRCICNKCKHISKSSPITYSISFTLDLQILHSRNVTKLIHKKASKSSKDFGKRWKKSIITFKWEYPFCFGSWFQWQWTRYEQNKIISRVFLYTTFFGH